MIRRARQGLAAVVLMLAGACGGPAAPWPTPPAGALDLRLQLAATTVPLLQPVDVQLDLYRRADLAVQWQPELPAADFLVESTVVEPERPFGAGFWQRTTLRLRPLRGPGPLVLPAFTARAADGSIAASTTAQELTVTSTLDAHGAAIEAPSDLLAPPSLLGWWLLGGFVLVGLGTALVVAWPRRRGQPPPGEVALPPHVKALRALARLKQAPCGTPAEVEAFYVEVSAVLRLYLEERFGLRAPERTTEEFLRDLEGGDRLAQAHRRELERFLSQCDLVKFAAHVPTAADHLATFALAEAFVEATRADRPPVGEVTP